jgi:hypothetical protein
MLVVASAVFFCLSINSMSTAPMSHDMSTTQNTATTHILHAQELTSANVIDGLLLALVSFFFVLAFTSPLFSRKLELFLQSRLFNYLRWRKRTLFSKVENIIHSYLSLFVRSPEYMYSA